MISFLHTSKILLVLVAVAGGAAVGDNCAIAFAAVAANADAAVVFRCTTVTLSC